MKSVLTATTAYTAISDIGNMALTNGYIGQIAGVTILEHALVPVDGEGQSIGCVFAPSAFGIAQRGGVAMETERKAAQRATDVVETVVAGAGILRPELAVQIKANKD
jgi:hypothetical protein